MELLTLILMKMVQLLENLTYSEWTQKMIEYWARTLMQFDKSLILIKALWCLVSST